MRVGFIGTGRIARRLVGGLAGSGHAISVTRRSEAVSQELAARYHDVEVLDSPSRVAAHSDAVVLCLAAHVAREVLPEVEFRAGQAVISVMADFTLDELRSAAAPATEVCITIPMPLIEQGGCPLPTHPRCPTLETIYGERNPVMPVESEDALAPFWAVVGTVASVLAELHAIATWLGERIGDPDKAERYVSHLYAGYLAVIDKGGSDRFGAALTDLSIEGGLNATLRERIEQSGHYDELRAGMEALYRRSRGEGNRE